MAVLPLKHDDPVTQREIRTVFAGLMLALALSSLDHNIVSTALPQIVSDLGGLSHLSWVVTAFMLTSTTTTPLYGKLSDMYGRKPIFVLSIMLFLIGSCLCGLSRTMTQLVIFRGVQGLGAGGLMTLSQTAVGDLVAPRDRGRYQGLFGAVFAASSIGGPLLGGFITDALSWRWIFYVNLPLGALALALILFGFKRKHRNVPRRIDYGGALFLSVWTTSLLLVLTWGGTTYPWSSPIILGLALVSLISFLLLVRQEHRAAEPVLSPRLFRNKVFVIASLAVGLTFMALLGAAVFMPVFFQLVLGMTPSRAGLMTAPLTLGIIVASFLGGRLVSRTGRYKIFPVVGLALAASALLGITWAAAARADLFVLVSALSLLGLGFGFVTPNLTVAVQNSVEFRELGMATATTGFFRSLGGAFGVALAGAMVNRQLHMHFSAGNRNLLAQGMQQIAQLPPAQKEAVLGIYRDAIGSTFLAGAGIAAVAFAIILFLPEKPLRTVSHLDSGAAASAAEAAGGEGSPALKTAG